MVKAILFDFGGVIAEEGFREGLKKIAEKNGLDPAGFYAAAETLIHETGYLTGRTEESEYWNMLRERTGIHGTDRELRQEILNRFIIRPRMIAGVDSLRTRGFTLGLLSDQTNWLDELDEKERIFRHFDRIFNSYHIHISKRDLSTFTRISRMLAVNPEETMFIDDNRNHVRRAASAGYNTILFTGYDDYERQMSRMIAMDKSGAGKFT